MCNCIPPHTTNEAPQLKGPDYGDKIAADVILTYEKATAPDRYDMLQMLAAAARAGYILRDGVPS